MNSLQVYYLLFQIISGLVLIAPRETRLPTIMEIEKDLTCIVYL